MKKVGMFIIIVCMVTSIIWIYSGSQLVAAETLKITQDQFEFRDEPRVADETLLGTLRIGTPVEWTGETSGRWFRVTAPNGQTGWVHASGLSTPQTRVQPTPRPAAQRSRSVSPPSSNQSQLQTTIRDLRQTNEQYESALEEKDRKIAQLTEDIEELEARLVDVAQLIDDQEQLRKVDQLKTTEIENELAALQETIKKKDEELLTEKVERTKLLNQIRELQAQTANGAGQERFWLYALSLPLNLIGLLVLGFWGIHHIRHKKSEEALLEAVIRERQETEALQERQEDPKKAPTPSPVITPQPQETQEHPPESGLEELDVVMAAASEEETEEVLAGEDEDVVIDLADVLPMSEKMASEKKEEEDVEILIDEGDVEEIEEVEVEVEVEDMEEAEEIENVEEAEEVEAEEKQPIIEETPIIETEGPEEEEAIEIFPEEMESIEPEQEDFDQMVVIETHEAHDEFPQEIQHEPELVLEPEELEIGDIEEEQVYEPEEVLDDDDMEALLEDILEMPQDTSIEELLEEGELEEEKLLPTKEIEQLPKPEEPEAVEIEGERFEMLVERNTQIIEPEEDETFEETLLYQEPTAEEEDTPPETQGDPPSSRKMKDPDTVTTFDDIAVSSSPEKAFESIDEELEISFEPEKEEGIQSDEDSQEIVSEAQDVEEAMLLDNFPSFLEPSPFLNEPEYEPEEGSLTSTEQEHDTEASAVERVREPRYDIELVDVGKNPGHIVHILSKIEGLTRSPQELVEQTPCIIARGAREADAKNFQVVMNKFGSEVRLIEKD